MVVSDLLTVGGILVVVVVLDVTVLLEVLVDVVVDVGQAVHPQAPPDCSSGSKNNKSQALKMSVFPPKPPC